MKKEQIVVHRTFWAFLTSRWCFTQPPLNSCTIIPFFFINHPSNCSCKELTQMPSIRVNKEMLRGGKDEIVWERIFCREFGKKDKVPIHFRHRRRHFADMAHKFLAGNRFKKTKRERFTDDLTTRWRRVTLLALGDTTWDNSESFRLHFCFGRCVFASRLGPILCKSHCFEWLSLDSTSTCNRGGGDGGRPARSEKWLSVCFLLDCLLFFHTGERSFG